MFVSLLVWIGLVRFSRPFASTKTPSRLQYLPGRCMMTLTHSLVDIDFSHQDLTESDSISFLVYCRHLQYLDLSFNPKLHLNPSVFFSSTRFTDSIGEGLPLYKNSLLSVDVSGCSNFDDLDIWFGLCSSLSEMHARKCSSRYLFFFCIHCIVLFNCVLFWSFFYRIES